MHSKFFHFPSTLIRSGTNETQVFDEQSPSGNDYLAEVRKKIHAFVTTVQKNKILKCDEKVENKKNSLLCEWMEYLKSITHEFKRILIFLI